MLNLVEKFTPEAVEATDEDGVVAIEYVIMAGVARRGPRRAVDRAFGALTAKLDDARSAASEPRHLIRYGGRATSPLRPPYGAVP